jgi:hypothetical protein
MTTYSSERYERAHGQGWVAFAGTMILIGGALNVIEGIAAIGKANFFVNDAHYVISNLSTWGWVHLFLGIALVLAGLGIFNRTPFAVWFGVAVASVNAVTQMILLPAYPFWSLAIFSLDILAVYGLLAYGTRRSRA